MKFVIADDSRPMRKMIERIVTEAGHRVMGEAGTGTEALRLCRQHRPDVAVLDLSMPDGRGETIIEACLKENLVSHIIVQSSDSQDAVFEPLRALGVRVISKPYAPARLQREIAALAAKP